MTPRKPLKILIGEDDPDIAELLEILLKNEGFRVVSCLDGEKTEEEIPKYKPDLIIMDLHLPKIDGESLIKKLKADEATKNIPIIIISAQNQLANRAKKVGADGFLPKPFDIEAVVELVHKFI